MALAHSLLLAAIRTVGQPLPTVVTRPVTRNWREPDKHDGNRWLRGVLEEVAFEGFESGFEFFGFDDAGEAGGGA